MQVQYMFLKKQIWLSAMPMQHMKAPESAQCYASTLYEISKL